MNKKESLALLAQGRDAWNAWAAKMSAEREALEAAGTWIAGRDEAEWNDATRAWRAAAEADFTSHLFKGEADFSGFVFPGDVEFSKATFSEDAKFDSATFSGAAGFDRATFSGSSEFDSTVFSGRAWFCGATFSSDAKFTYATFADCAWFAAVMFQGGASFAGATFSGDARFQGSVFSSGTLFRWATFSGDAKFNGATFSDGPAMFSAVTFEGNCEFAHVIFGGGYTQFANTRFEKTATFSAIDCKSAFSLDGATFLSVPDFIQAHFTEAPRLDNSRIQPRRVGRSSLATVQNYFEGDRHLAARWRALKRLAVQGHDHMHELEFFKNELKARRWTTDRPWHAVFWFGLFYGWFSDFGRSIVRPLIWWAASAWAFALLYLYTAVSPALNCLAGPGDPWQAALWISARKALLFFGLDSSDKLTQHYACLYGVITQQPAPAAQLPAGVHLDVPDSVIAFGIA